MSPSAMAASIRPTSTSSGLEVSFELQAMSSPSSASASITLRNSWHKAHGADFWSICRSNMYPRPRREFLRSSTLKPTASVADRMDEKEMETQQLRASPSGEETVEEPKGAMSIAEQLSAKYEALPTDMQKKMELRPKTLPAPVQRRRQRQQEYWARAKERDDSSVFITVGLLVLVPPLAILGMAIAVGYVEILP